MATAKERLEYLRGEIEAERISQGEIAELQSLAEHIEPGDVLLLEWAGVPECRSNKICTGCGDSCDETEGLECTDCGKWFCDNCYDTGKGDGCHCHALPLQVENAALAAAVGLSDAADCM